MAYVARQRGGLCNNLKCYLSAVRMAARDSVSVATDCVDLLALHDNLVPSDTLSPETQFSDVCDWRFTVMAEDDLPTGFARSSESRGFRDADPGGRNIDFEYHRIPAALRDSYLDALATMNPRPALMERVDSFAREYLDEDAVSLHLRTWLTDHWDQAPKRNAHFYDESAYRRVIEDSPNNIFFLSSDNSTHAEKLALDYDGQIVLWPSDSQLTSTETAYINLRLLGSNSHIVGSRLSTFTEMAWWYTGCRARITLL